MRNFDEDSSVTNALTEVVVQIDRPPEVVWRQFLDIGSWVTSHHIEEVQGARGSLGSITRVSYKDAVKEGYPSPHYHYCKIIEVIPQQRYVLKTYSEDGGSYGVEITGFDDARFISKDGGTQITFNFFEEFRGKPKVSNDRSSINTDASRDGMVKNLNNLKRIVESS
jgi:uncharacterized protein YndB with AHSA1/START domain